MSHATNIAVNLNGVDKTAQAFNSVSERARRLGAINGVDKTAGAFDSVSERARRLGAIKGQLLAVGAAAAAIGAAFNAIDKASQAMSKMSDLAADAGIASGQIQQLAGAFGQMGVKGASAERVADMFQQMVKRTGQEGVQGFGNLLASISQLGTEQERVTALTEAFGRANALALAVLVRNGPEGVAAIADIGSNFVTASEEAYNAADKFADGWLLVCQNSQQVWYQFAATVVDIVGQSMGIAMDDIGDFFEGVRNIADKVAGVIGGVLGTIVLAVRALKNSLQTIFDLIATGITMIADPGNAGELWDAFKERQKEAWGDLVSDAVATWDKAVDHTLGRAKETRKTLDELKVPEKISLDFKSAKENAEKAAKPSREESPNKFADAMTFGSSALQKLVFGRMHGDWQAKQYAEAQKSNEWLERIDGTLAGLEAI
jgi:hypothetical protein